MWVPALVELSEEYNKKNQRLFLLFSLVFKNCFIVRVPRSLIKDKVVTLSNLQNIPVTTNVLK